MKRLLSIATLILCIVVMTLSVWAEFSEFESGIYSQISEGETRDIEGDLESIGVDPDNPESVGGLSVRKIVDYVLDIFKEALTRPTRIILITAVFAAICQLATTLSYKAGLYGELFVLICFITLSPYVIDAFNSVISAMMSCQTFMATYIPAFAAVVAASGNVAAAASYNAIVLYFCEAAAFIATSVLRPILCCMLVMSAVQALNPDLMNITSTLRNALTTIIGFVMTLFLGIIGLETLVGRSAEGLAVKAGKYAVSSFVPVIGYSLSESYKAVSLSLSAIRTTVGTFGIVVLCAFMLSPIISAVVYKAAFMLCSWLCRLTGADRIAAIMGGLADVFSFLSTVLTMFMLMMVVSTGMLIILGSEVLI